MEQIAYCFVRVTVTGCMKMVTIPMTETSYIILNVLIL